MQETIFREPGLPLENVRVIVSFVGGGFGGKSAHSQGVEAARLAKITGKPVMFARDRKEEFFCDTFLLCVVVKITSGMDKSGTTKYQNFRGCQKLKPLFPTATNHRREAANRP